MSRLHFFKGFYCSLQNNEDKLVIDYLYTGKRTVEGFLNSIIDNENRAKGIGLSRELCSTITKSQFTF